ncbi:MAG: GNAT family N-acetyltransferase [Alphaproteobacteria bacterium]|nr:GNAT family N-acetyltransferase [Alphaproteobacteria bacterium]
MPDSGDSVTVKVVSGIDEIPAAAWDACAGPDNPFVSHAFLQAMEDSGSACAESGWAPQHVVIEDADGRVAGAVPCYLKNHSYGEYVFDWGWADAYERAGGRYYPKLQCSVPFSPVTGPRLLVREGDDAPRIRQGLIAGLMALAEKRKVATLHVTFCHEDEWDALEEAGFLKRMGQQFHWHNRGYENFEDFLGELSSRKRKAVRKERREANEEVDIQVLSGEALKDEHMEAFYRFYLDTVDRRWAHAYLNRKFFRLLRERMAERIVLVLAMHDGEYVGGALNLRGSDTLYGRNWGCIERFNKLYFEACFYRAIDYAIEHGLAKVEAGAQGPHKISRGYLPSATYSAHWIRDTGFRDAVADFAARERREILFEMEHLTEQRSPYRRGALSTPVKGGG